MSSLQVTDQEASAVAKAPRVSLSDIEASIAARYDTTAELAAGTISKSLSILSLCIIEMRNGFVVIGKSGPASPENFVAELGRKFAYEDAVRQIWPLMGYALRDRLHKGHYHGLDRTGP